MKFKLPGKKLVEPWADEHFSSFAAVGLFLLTSDYMNKSL